MNSNPMKSISDMKEKLEIMTTELFLYKERVNEIETSDKKLIVYISCISCIAFCYMVWIFLYMVLYPEIWDILNVIWEILNDIYIY